jgi:23S rRNA (uracil1939-C5)-methyltransferase
MTTRPRPPESPARPGDVTHQRPRAAARIASLDVLEVEVEKLVAGGDGLARFEGIPIFIPLSAPGDRLRVQLVERRPDYGRAEILEILEPGPGRRQAPCPYFGRCGGCDLQHLEDDLQVDLKAAAVEETLRRLGGVTGELPVRVVRGEPWAYRLRTQLHINAVQGMVEVGYHSRRSSEVVAIDQCPVLAAELEGVLRHLPGLLGEEHPRRLDLLAGDAGVLSSAPVVPGLPHGEVRLRVGDLDYRLDARCFFQSHRQLLATLVETAVGDWGGQHAFDLYAGVGFLSLPLAQRYERVTAVEGDRVAARYARRNGREHRCQRLEVVTRAVEGWVSELPDNAERVVVDPPRAGLSRVVRNTLVARAPNRLTYVSCHAGTLARDLRILGDIYSIEELVLLDMFPQTGHMEVVVQLIRRQGV